MESIDQNRLLEDARRAYGKLDDPDYGFFAAALEGCVWKNVIDELKGIVNVEDWTDREDGVGISLELSARGGGRGSGVWSLWLSAVGPYALLAFSVGEIRREDVLVSPRPDASCEERRIIEVLREANFLMVSADDAERAVVEFCPEEKDFPSSTFLMIFGESGVPWRNST